ncbi:MAG TPA: thioredoxin-dependent thiol peroxidase [Nitrospiria bacterium]|jgi:peroxiredoxin Q/BCP
MKIKVGQNAPDFSLPSNQGGTVHLKDFKNKKSVILFFYPKDNTPGCTKEACGFRDLNDQFKKTDAVVFGISLDSIESHQNFTNKYQLSFPLLSDKDAQVSKTYGVYGQKSMYGKKFFGINRSTFVINKKGIIEEIYEKIKVETHPKEVLEKLNQNT